MLNTDHMSQVDENVLDLKPSEVARELRCHRNTVLALLKAGMVPGAYTVGSRWRVPRRALDNFKLAQSPKGCAPQSAKAKRKARAA